MIAIYDSICQVSCTSARVTVLSKENKVRPFDLEPFCVFTFFIIIAVEVEAEYSALYARINKLEA